MNKPLFLVPLLAVACSYPRFTATKIVEVEVPLAQATKLHCKTHNGSIKITRGDSSKMIQLRTEMKVRGQTQAEADENLHLLSVAHESDGDTLRIFGEYPRSQMNNRSPTFSYTMKVPEHLAVTLISHNGNIHSDGTKGPLHIETHNGQIAGSVANAETRIETHNGGIAISIDSDQPLDGNITSHNGSIKVRVLDTAHCWLEARTHNGRISPPSTIHDATIKRRSLRCRLGTEETEGRLRIETHNGNIRILSGKSEMK